MVRNRRTQGKKGLDHAVQVLDRIFPFADYTDSLQSHRVVAEAVMRYLVEGSLLDVGSGACAKAALLSLCGYRVSACDDLLDPWHLRNDNRKRIIEFARQVGIDFFLDRAGHAFPYQAGQFDLVLMSDILEHLHHSPLELLCQVLEWLKPGGFLLVTVPNAANLRKRVSLLVGRTNYPPFEDFFWSPMPWRGHVREYVLHDLKLLSQFTQLDVVELRDIHKMAYGRLKSALSRYLYYGATAVPIPGIRDSLLLVARKPQGWSRQHVSERRSSDTPVIRS